MRDTPTTWEKEYQSGQTPWDSGITPPEVVEFWSSKRLPAQGVALDLGCGTATNVAYLAGLGLTAIGVEHAPTALLRGQQRLRERDLGKRAHLIQGNVTALPFSQLGGCYMLDIGCFHGLYPEMRDNYVAGVVDNLAAGGIYHLYAFDRVDALRNDPERAHRGVEENEIVERFQPWLQVVEIVRARPDRYPCRWYLLRR